MKKIITIEGMHCDHCKSRVEAGLKGVSGVKNAKVSLKDKTATVNLKEEIADNILTEAVKELGFEPLKIEVKKGLLG